jgi:hypothetical protein
MIVKNRHILYIATAAISFMAADCLPLPSIDDGTDTGTDGVTDKEPSHLLAHYSFENSFDDVSGMGKNGVGLNDPSFITDTPSGKGFALKLNGFKDQYVNIPYQFFYDEKNYSISLWLKDFSIGVIISASGSRQTHYDFPKLMSTDNSKFQFFAKQDNSGGDYTDEFSLDFTSIQSNDWHHIVVTCEEFGEYDVICRLYVDGQLIDSIESGWTESSCQGMFIGGTKNGEYPNAISAKYDEVRIYGCTLSASEIYYLYNNCL